MATILPAIPSSLESGTERLPRGAIGQLTPLEAMGIISDVYSGLLSELVGVTWMREDIPSALITNGTNYTTVTTYMLGQGDLQTRYCTVATDRPRKPRVLISGIFDRNLHLTQVSVTEDRGTTFLQVMDSLTRLELPRSRVSESSRRRKIVHNVGIYFLNNSKQIGTKDAGCYFTDSVLSLTTMISDGRLDSK